MNKVNTLLFSKLCRIFIYFSTFLLSSNLFGQVSTYTFASVAGAYAPIVGGTVFLNGASPSMDDVISGSIAIPNFSINCNTYSSIFISTNGFITFGATAPTATNYTPISSAEAYTACVSPLGANLNKAAAGTPEIRYQNLVGSSEFVIQWQDLTRLGKGDRISFQVRLNYSNNTINIVYGGTISAGATNPTVQVGLRGSTNVDFNNRSTAANWSATVAGGANNSTCAYSSTGPVLPSVGLTYTWTPISMTYVSSTVVQASVATVSTCDYDQAIISVQIVVSGCANPMSATQFIMNMVGTNPTVDVSLIHIYYTGTSNVFNNTNEFLVGGTAPAAGNITINGVQVLTGGTNYFWIAYDMNAAGTVGDNVDALLLAANSITVGGVTETPTANNPAGTRTIVACPAFPGTAGGNLKFWVKSDVGIVGSPVSSWADQSTAGVTGNLLGQLLAKRPSFVANAINFQPYIVFNGTTDVMRSANKFVGTNLFNATDNTILMVKQWTGGGVDFKWATTGSGPYRMSMELTGANAQRFDFANDGGITPPPSGLNAGSTNILNKDIILAAQSNSTTNTMYLNGNFESSFTYSLAGGPLTFAPGATQEALYIGGNDTVFFVIPAAVKIGEVMIYNKQLSASELKRAETYLALKYGITLGNNQGNGIAVSYVASDGTLIWSNTGFHNFVIGIGRDNAAGNSGLNKLRSTSVSSLNGSTDILTVTNGIGAWTGTAFGSDKSFLVIGNNAAALSETAIGANDLPAGIAARIDRVWKAQQTGTVGTVTLKFDMSTVLGVGNVGGANDLSQVRLLVDADGVFATGASTQIVPTAFSNVSDTVTFQVAFTGATGFYFTIGSVNIATAPLPIELLCFNANVCESNVCLDWATATEVNNDYFTIEKTKDIVNFDFVAKVNGAGNSTIVNDYTAIDKAPYEGVSYYRLKQTDYNGAYTYSNLKSVNFTPNTDFSFNLYPNPSAGEDVNVAINAGKGQEVLVVVYDVTGQETYSKVVITEDAGKNIFALDPSGKLTPGVYLITATSQQSFFSKKLIIK